MPTQRERNFPAVWERLRPQCEVLAAQYEEPRSALLPIMHLFAEQEGFVSPQAMRAAAEMLGLTPAVVESTVSFYTLFFRKPVGKYVLQVCRGLSCTINGAQDVMAYLREKLGIEHLQTTEDGLISYEEVECLAACDRATCMQVNLEYEYDLTPAKIDVLLDSIRAGTYHVAPMPQTDHPERTWVVKPDTEVGSGSKSAGARGVSNPNNPGGAGDASGVIMLDRFVDMDSAFRGRTSERLVQNAADVRQAVEE